MTEQTGNFFDEDNLADGRDNRAIECGSSIAKSDHPLSNCDTKPYVEVSFLKNINALADLIDELKRRPAGTEDAAYRRTCESIHKAYYYSLAAEMRRLREGTLMGVELGIPDVQ